MSSKPYDKFNNHKKYLRKNKNAAILLLVCSVYLFLMILVAALINSHFPAFLAAILLPFPLLILSLCSLIKHIRLIKQFSQINVGETYEIKLYRPKVTFLTYTPFSLSRYNRMVLCYGVTLYDYQTQIKYHYIMGEAFPLDKDGMKKLQAKFFKELCIQCYGGTTLIQVIEDDPHFLKIRASYNYE